MRKSIVLLGVCTVLVASIAWAKLDLSDFDEDIMDKMDDAVKDLEVVIPAHNAASARLDAETIQAGLTKTSEYFAAQGVDDGVHRAHEAQALTQKILEALERQDFDAALVAVGDTKKSCHSCHEMYKPKKDS